MNIRIPLNDVREGKASNIELVEDRILFLPSGKNAEPYPCRSAFGFSSFRPNQEAVCRAAVEGRDVLLVMPTGSGKSLCYQLPASRAVGPHW